MNFTYYDLGHLKRGSTVVVTLSGNRANVRLMDSSNYHSFKSGRQHRFVGGLATGSPVRLQVPNDGQWYVTVDLMGLGGTVRSGVHVEPPPLAPLRPISSQPLSAIRHDSVTATPVETGETVFGEGQRDRNGDDHVWDVFISHATEDKDEVARPLADHLHGLGVSVWLDVLELKIGDSLRRKIDHGLAHSRFGIVILSRHFFAKQWPQYELDGLVTRQNSGEQSLLPIWHEITKAEVVAASPSLADKIARSTSQFTVEEIAAEIAEVIRPAESA